VPDFFRRYSPWRTFAAAVVAYCFVLQALLGAIVVTQMAATAPLGGFEICTADSSPPVDRGKGRLPAGHLTCALCSLPSSSPPLPQASGTAFVAPSAASFNPVALNSFIVEGRRHGPQSPRGPPQVA
jgi:heme A synthase